MTGYSAITETGKVPGGGQSTVWLPRVLSSAKGSCGIVLCHGFTNRGIYWSDPNLPGQSGLAHSLAHFGMPMVACDQGDTFGNATGQALVDACWAYLAGLAPIRTDKVLLVGLSMGGGLAMNYAAANPAKVAAIVNIAPLSNMASSRARNPFGTVKAGIEAAWGISSSAPLPPNSDPADPVHMAPAFGIPYVAYVSSADTVIPIAEAQSTARLLGGSTRTISTTLDHSDPEIAQVPVSEAAAFLAARAR